LFVVIVDVSIVPRSAKVATNDRQNVDSPGRRIAVQVEVETKLRSVWEASTPSRRGRLPQ